MEPTEKINVPVFIDEYILSIQSGHTASLETLNLIHNEWISQIDYLISNQHVHPLSSYEISKLKTKLLQKATQIKKETAGFFNFIYYSVFARKKWAIKLTQAKNLENFASFLEGIKIDTHQTQLPIEKRLAKDASHLYHPNIHENSSLTSLTSQSSILSIQNESFSDLQQDMMNDYKNVDYNESDSPEKPDDSH